MKVVGFSGESLISWHRKFAAHPIADPAFAKENLVSLAETLVMLALYLASFILILHWFVVLGYIKPQTIPCGITEAATRFLFYRIPTNLYFNKLNIFMAIITNILAIKLTRRAFEITKAKLHPKNHKKY